MQPNDILLMIGTNDVNGAYDPGHFQPDGRPVRGRRHRAAQDRCWTRSSRRGLPRTCSWRASSPIQHNATALTRAGLFNDSITQNVILTNPSYAGKDHLTSINTSSFLNPDGSINTNLYADDHPSE